ncbi:AsmA family protein [Crenalkalicoccus roseus]|uniref:AsmA family protein n=1 Tax=Crenalkalicoccus roseus TaxID=1485588 RepID=UPI001081D661|nr:AsmA family protein [Crenalkalicoccus roseus]
MRRLAALGLALLALALAAIWAVPRLLDWEHYRAELAYIAGHQLGRTVTLDGPITLALLPQPRVEAAAVSILPEGDGLTFTAETLEVRLDLGALLAGRLEPRELVIVKADIRLPWPPAELPSFRPPAWLTTLDARLEDSRLVVGGLRIEGLDARLVTGGVTEALVAEGSFAWRGQAVRFTAQLGRAGFDGIAPLDLSLAAGGAVLSAHGTLQPGGGFEGRLEAAGSDLSALLPAPALPFRATGRLSAAADLIAATGLGLDLGGQPARGAAALRLTPAPRLEIALAAGRLDLDAWVAAARGARPRPIPVGIDLSAEATAFAGMPLRRLRGAFFLEGERLTFSDVTALLPGETEVALDGATAGQRIELALRFETPNAREVLAALGVPVAATDPARLRRAEGRFRLALQEGQATISDLAAVLDGARVSGAGVVRQGARPAIGLGLTFNRLDLDGLLPPPAAWSGPPPGWAGLDLNLRLAAEEVAWGGVGARRASLDATLEAGRLTLRRLAFRLAELDIAAAGTAAPGAGPTRLSELSLEVTGSAGAATRALLPAAWAGLLPAEEGVPVALRLSGGGVPEALGLKAEADLGDLRLEAQGTLDGPGRRGSGTLTLRHPGAPRLLAPLLGPGVEEWLGQGSFSVIASLAGTPQAVAAEHLDLVAGVLRARGQLALALGAARPRLTGRLAAERLPLPGAGLSAGEPLGFGRLGRLDAELALEAERLEIPGAPALEQAAATLGLAEGRLGVEGFRARLAGGTLQGALLVEAGAEVPRLALEAELAGATVAGPVLGLPLDLGAGRVGGTARLRAEGHSLAALAATVSGEVTLLAEDGVLIGYDLPAILAAAAEPALDAAEAGLRRALAEGGATAFERLEVAARLDGGRAMLDTARLATEGGAEAVASGEADLGRAALDLALATAPVAGAPPVVLRLAGPAAAPRRLPEAAAFLRWRAQRG